MSDETKFNMLALAGPSAEERERIRKEEQKKEEIEKRIISRVSRIQKIAMNVPHEKLAERVSWLMVMLHEERQLMRRYKKLAESHRSDTVILRAERDSAREVAQEFGVIYYQHKHARKAATDTRHARNRELRDSARGLWETWQEFPGLYANKDTFDEEVSAKLKLKKDTLRKWREGWQKSSV